MLFQFLGEIEASIFEGPNLMPVRKCLENIFNVVLYIEVHVYRDVFGLSDGPDPIGFQVRWHCHVIICRSFEGTVRQTMNNWLGTFDIVSMTPSCVLGFNSAKSLG